MSDELETPNPDPNPNIHQHSEDVVEDTGDSVKPVESNLVAQDLDLESDPTPSKDMDVDEEGNEVDNSLTDEELDNDANYKATPNDENTSSEVHQELSDALDKVKKKSGKEVEVFGYDKETKKAHVRVKGHNARATEQIISSDPNITSVGRDDFRDTVQVGTEPSPIRDRYCFDVNGNRTAYYD